MDGHVKAVHFPDARMSTTAPQTNVMQYQLQTGYDNIAPAGCVAAGQTPPYDPDGGVAQGG